jgi:hypothetical protein
MSAKRYSGNATITVSIDDSQKNYEPGRQSYRVSIVQGKNRATMPISAPIAHGSGVSVDSPEMFDEVARSALSFATNDREIDEDGLDFDDQGWAVSRKKR